MMEAWRLWKDSAQELAGGTCLHPLHIEVSKLEALHRFHRFGGEKSARSSIVASRSAHASGEEYLVYLYSCEQLETDGRPI
jgi:hypothetical protein